MATPDDPDQLSRPGVPRAGGGPRAPAANPAPLRWATGVFLTYIGARGLIVPQVSNQGAIDGLALLAPTVEGFLIVQALLRVAILLAGVGLIFVAARPHHRRFALVAQAAAFIVLAWWSVVLLVSSAVAAASYFGALALGIGVSAFVERERGRAWGRGRHPFSLVMILAALPVGVLMLLPLGPYQAPVYRPVADQLPWVGAGFLVGCAMSSCARWPTI